MRLDSVLAEKRRWKILETYQLNSREENNLSVQPWSRKLWVLVNVPKLGIRYDMLADGDILI